MTPKIQKLAREIEKTRKRIAELQERLREMERLKTELENTEIVALFRSLDVAADRMSDFITAMRDAAVLPEAASLDAIESLADRPPDMAAGDPDEVAPPVPSLYSYDQKENAHEE